MDAKEKGIKILLLEDDLHLRRGIALALELQRFKLFQASNGLQGLEWMREISPDLIISDINMPLMNGFKFLEAVRDRLERERIPFIFLTGKDAAPKTADIPNYGSDDYITKPINTVNLLRVIYLNLLKAAEAKHGYRNAAFLQTIQEIARTLESRDTLTEGHIDRVTRYTRLFLEALDWPESKLEISEYGTRLHDIGKITVPDHILNKPQALSETEWHLVKNHPDEGAAIIEKVDLLKDAVAYVRFHHEKWDGSGYPQGLTGDQIPIEARVLAIVDAFDSMTSDRPYRKALPLSRAAHELAEKAGKDFDPDLVEVFMSIVETRIKTDFEQAITAEQQETPE